MSKKWKNKLKKQQKTKLIQQSTATDSQVANEEIILEKNDNKQAAIVNKKERSSQVENDNFLPEIAQVKHDIKKIGIVFGLIIIILIAITIVNEKTDVVIKLADAISKLIK